MLAADTPENLQNRFNGSGQVIAEIAAPFVQATPKGVFDASAVAAFSAARFSPGKLLGVPAKSQLTFEVHFTPVDRGANVTAPTY